MSIAQKTELLKTGSMVDAVRQLQQFVQQAAQDGMAMHEFEPAILRQVLQIGHHAVQTFLDAQGTGDLGETTSLPDGRLLNRLEQTHTRPLHTVFGEFQIERTAYGTREGQAIELVPLDTRLQLPEGKFSYLLQQWDMMLGVEQPFGTVGRTLQAILGIEQHVDSLERISRQMAQAVEPFHDARVVPPSREEGAILVSSADHKGVPMRRASQDPPIRQHDRQRGPKPGRKKMATVGSVYTIDQHRRTPQQIVESLFRRPDEPRPKDDRPQPCHKHVWACLSYEDEEGTHHGTEQVFGWITQELQDRDPKQRKELVCLMDGEEALWEACEWFVSDRPVVGILDLLHVTPRLWEAAHVWHARDSAAAEQFVRDRVLRVLRGEVGYVTGGLRQMATKAQLRGKRLETIERICTYFDKNRHRMRYDEYLAAGYPIASGVIEGACRHLVKDRMERAGMHWVLEGAQAMLNLRSVQLSDAWDEFSAFRIERETARLYPYHAMLEDLPWPMAA